MGNPGTVSRQEAIQSMHGLQKSWKLKEHKARMGAHSEDGKTIISEMSNVLEIAGVEVKDVPETEFVEFDDQGLTKTYRLYCEPSPIKQVFADLTANTQ